MTRRTDRVNELLRETLSELFLREVKDPRVSHELLSITEVDVSPDLRRAIVYVSHMGTEAERAAALDALGHAAHFLQREMGHRLKLRRVPELTFRFDPSIERGARLTSLIHEAQAARGDEEGSPAG
jgi:ribosome-binding factor A